MTTGADVVAEARRWLETPFMHQGRVLGVGVDCVGVPIMVAQARGLSDFDIQAYGRQPNGSQMRAFLDANMDRVPMTDSAVGDLLLMRIERDPQHLAILTDKGILHAHASVGRCVEHGIDDRWRRRIIAVYRFRGLG
jgi:cell wall-associated NlpC family hydrolase